MIKKSFFFLLKQRQAELERSLKEPPSAPLHRGHSMMADIRRPPVEEMPMIAETKRPQSARRSQDVVFFPQPPAEGWECNSCGFANDGRPNCEECNSPYTATGNHRNQVPVQRPQVAPPNQRQLFSSSRMDVSNANQAIPEVQLHGKVSNIVGAFDQTNQNQTSQPMQQSSPVRSPSRNAVQQAKVLEAQLPGKGVKNCQLIGLVLLSSQVSSIDTALAFGT